MPRSPDSGSHALPARPQEMIPVQRRGLLLDLLRRQGTASVRELARASEASEATVRRDLEQLELAGYLRRTRGGAMLAQSRHSAFEPEAAVAARVARAEKRAIGEAAARLLENGDSVIFDSGSTVHMAAAAAAARNLELTAVTNDLGIAQTLAGPAGIRVVVLGGTLRKGSLSLIGEPGLSMLRDMRVDVAYVGTQAVDEQALSDASIEIATVKKAIIAAARRVILLADGSKFQTASFFRFGDTTAVHEVITDPSAPPAVLARLRERGIAVTVVAPQS